MKLHLFLLVIVATMASCTLDEAESSITCGLGLDADLLDNPPGNDSIYFTLRSTSNSILNKNWRGIIDQELTDSLGQTSYENVGLIYRTPSNNLQEMNGVGTQIEDPQDSSTVTISFDFIERSTIEQACRFNKTLNDEHLYSYWGDNLEGARIDVLINSGGEEFRYTTDFNNSREDTFTFNLTGVEVLDENSFFGMVKGNYTAQLVNQADPNDLESISGEFQYIAQISFGVSP